MAQNNMRKMFTEQQLIDLVKQNISIGYPKINLGDFVSGNTFSDQSTDEEWIKLKNYIDNIWDNEETTYEPIVIIGFDENSLDGFGGIFNVVVTYNDDGISNVILRCYHGTLDITIMSTAKGSYKVQVSEL